MSDPFLAMIIIFGGSYAPVNWAFCQGTLIAVSANQALFSLVGTMYGGDGISTFALPDLRGRVPIGIGQGPDWLDHYQGEFNGVESVVLQVSNLPAHSHTTDISNLVVTPSASTAAGTTNIPGPMLVPAKYPTIGGGPSATGINGYAVNDNSTTLAPAIVTGSIIGNTGSDSPLDIRNPSMAMNYIIALSGIFPTRS